MRPESKAMLLVPLYLMACNTPQSANSVDATSSAVTLGAPSAVPPTPEVRTTKPDGSTPFRVPAVLLDAGQPDGSMIDGGKLGADPSRR